MFSLLRCSVEFVDVVGQAQVKSKMRNLACTAALPASSGFTVPGGRQAFKHDDGDDVAQEYQQRSAGFMGERLGYLYKRGQGLIAQPTTLLACSPLRRLCNACAGPRCVRLQCLRHPAAFSHLDELVYHKTLKTSTCFPSYKYAG